MSVPVPDPLLGTTIGPYRVMAQLGAGGMGAVYLAESPAIGSRVAIKVMAADLAPQPDAIERFFAEARAVNHVRHEGIVNVMDLATLGDGRPYMVMEYLDGTTLSAAIHGAAPLPLAQVGDLVLQVLAALGAAHAKGIVHRDLKPDNIMITPGGRTKVLDFGVVKLAPDLGGAVTQHIGLRGTPNYMSPEQASAVEVDARTDLYAVGVILYEAVTQRVPFAGATLFEILAHHMSTAPTPPSQLRRDVTPALEHVILTALAKDPEHRFRSAAAMAEALRQALGMRASQPKVEPDAPGFSNFALTAVRDAVPTPAAVTTSPAPAPSPPRRGVPAAALAAIGALIVGIGSFALIRHYKASARPAPTPTAASPVTPPSVLALAPADGGWPPQLYQLPPMEHRDHVAVDGLVQHALALTSDEPDRGVIRIVITGIDRDGVIDFTRPYASATIQLASARRLRAHAQPCGAATSLGGEGRDMYYPLDDAGCANIQPVPRCAISTVVRRAAAQAGAGMSRASVAWGTSADAPARWLVSLEIPGQASPTVFVDDDCAPAATP